MAQNRNQLIQLFVGNIYNAIVHSILEKAIDKEEIKEKYDKELKSSFAKAEIYRAKINPINNAFPTNDAEELRKIIINRVNRELKNRELRGYKNIDFSLVEILVEDYFKKLNIV
ncbi:hypothetical protein J4218_04535 [Candidatus Pacearchaeota archaeon]|nr:hypothetical protein [Candidatus Pacearchaeota archaeon]